MTQLTGPAELVERDRYGRPKLLLPDCSKRVAYTRATTLAGVCDDTYNLSRWQQRMVAIGLLERPALLDEISNHRGDKGRLNRICEDAIEAAKGGDAARTGTAIHQLTEAVDRGQELPAMRPETARDLDAYRQVTAGLNMVAIEEMVVLDDIRVAGTPDRIVELDGRRLIFDLKTGADLSYSIQKIAAQLAIYSRGLRYDHATAIRHPIDVDQNNAIVCHVPAGTGRAELLWIDIGRGWEGVELALKVRDWRNAKGLTVPVVSDSSRQPA